MTDKEILTVIKTKLGETIKQAIIDSKTTLYTEDWLGAMAMREMGHKIDKLMQQGKTWAEIVLNAKGDYGQRSSDDKPIYHGFGFWQIDIASFPQFIKSGDWVDPYKCAMKAISVLEGKRKYLATKFPTVDDRAITAAYNCGEGNVTKALRMFKDVDVYTHQKNYSAEVWRYREIYKSI